MPNYELQCVTGADPGLGKGGEGKGAPATQLFPPPPEDPPLVCAKVHESTFFRSCHGGVHLNRQQVSNFL